MPPQFVRLAAFAMSFVVVLSAHAMLAARATLMFA
jgi:hypothetical protein